VFDRIDNLDRERRQMEVALEMNALHAHRGSNRIRPQNMVRRGVHQSRCALCGRARSARLRFAENTLDRRAADLTAEADDLHRNGSGAQLSFRAQLADLVNEPTASFRNLVDRSQKEAARLWGLVRADGKFSAMKKYDVAEILDAE
jgi:hypothetical protein